MESEKPNIEKLQQKIENLENLLDIHKIIIDNSVDWEILMTMDGDFTYVSPSCKIISGYSASEFTENSDLFIQIVYPLDKELVNHHLYEKKHNAETDSNLEFRIKTKDGNVKWIEHFCQKVYDNSGNIFGFRSSNRDITKRKEIEIELKKANKALDDERHLFSQGNVIIFKWKNENNWPVEYVSSNVKEILGYAEEEIISPQFIYSNLIYPGDLERITKEVIFYSNQQTENFEHTPYRLICKNGKIIWVSDYTIILRNETGEIINYIGYLVDSTVIVENEMKLREQNNEYESLNEEYKSQNEILLKALVKAEESDCLKTSFLQNMSHEIRTPMNAITGFASLLDNPDLSCEKRKSFTTIIINSTKQLLSIVTDILTISSLETKQEKVYINKVCINSIIVDLFAIFKTQAQNQNISLYTKQQLNDKQSEIYTDKTKVTQILTNLLFNALKFTHEGFIEFGYNLKTDIEPAEMEFYVKDSGIGIKPEFHEKIFERFRQAETGLSRLYGGTGLGLSISKSFAELLDGKIWVQSEPEKGSIFYFTIPYKPVNEIDKTPTTQNENFRTVLVAEDEEYNFLFIKELLIDMNLKLIHAKNGQETVEICKSNSKIDLILMDIRMPIMDGYTAATQIRKFCSDLPIIAQSAYALEHEIEKYSGIFDDYITKPIDKDILKHKVMQYINQQIDK